MSEPVALLDPFALTPNTKAYVPRAATERALAVLLQSVRVAGQPVAVTGPSGLGKTLLLHLLAERVESELHPVYLPYAALPPEDLCTWTLAALGSRVGDDPLAALEASARRLLERGSALLLLIDDAGAMPLAAARWIGALAERRDGALRLAVAATDGAAASRAIAALGPRLRSARLTAPMRRAEMLEYVTRRLALAGVPPAIRARFDRRTVLRLHGVAAGNPRRLHIVASALLRGARPEVPEDWFLDLHAARGAPRPAPQGAAPAGPGARGPERERDRG